MRAQGRIPAVVYGKTESLPISVGVREFDTILRKHGSGAFILELKIEGPEEKERLTLLKEVQRDPITSRVLHVDFLQISMDQSLHVKVPVHLEGTPVGVKEGGLLEVLAREVDVQCRAAEIPEEITIDVSGVGIGQSVHVSDLTVPDGVAILTPANRVIATVIVKILVAEPVAAVAEATPGEAAKETEKKGPEAPGEAASRS